MVELYDKWFTETDVTRELPQQPWESDKEFKSRQSTKHETFVGFRGDDEDFDPEKPEHEVPAFDLEN